MPNETERRRLPGDARVDIWTAADGWPLRRVRLPARGMPRGAMMFAAGRGDFVEKYLESLLDWRARGWTVDSFDWRGQGLSGRLASDPALGHVASFEPWLADLAQLIALWRRETGGPHVLIGHSTGAHLLLRHLARHPADADAAVLLSPLMGLRRALPDGVLALLARLMVVAGRGERYAWGQERALANELRSGALTGDNARYADEAWWWRTEPRLKLGGASWGWVAAALASIARLRAPGALEGVTTPLLVMAADDDRLVSTPAIRAAVRRLPRARALFLPGARHELLRETDDLRNRVLAAIDDFLEPFVEAA